MHASKIDDLTLFTIVMALAAAWLVAVVGLALTVERKYLRTFVSLQTGYGMPAHKLASSTTRGTTLAAP